MRIVTGLIFFFAMLVAAPAAEACPVCFSAEGGTLNAFRLSTVFLTLLPVIAFVSFFYWYRRKLKDQDQQ